MFLWIKKTYNRSFYLIYSSGLFIRIAQKSKRLMILLMSLLVGKEWRRKTLRVNPGVLALLSVELKNIGKITFTRCLAIPYERYLL